MTTNEDTKAELDEMQKLVDAERKREAAQPLLSKAWDRFQDHREAHPYTLPAIGFAFLVATVVAIVRLFL